MTLPQEISDHIEKDAEHYANVQWTEKAKHIGHEQSRNWDHSKDDYEAGATEWAGKTQEKEAWYLKRIQSLRDTLEQIIHAPVPANEREYISWFVTVKNVAGGAVSQDDAEIEVAKYKEVGNG